jgi:hypothetical protein
MINFRLQLIRFKVHSLLNPLNNFILKTGNFLRLSKWISEHQKLNFNDYYSPLGKYMDRYNLYQHILDNEINDQPINYLEFGVGDGETLKWWANCLQNKSSLFYGFDTFQGLPEAWGFNKKGAFSTNGIIPETNDERISFYEGLFQDTLANFLPGLNNTQKSIILLDADLYSSTLFVLTTIAPYLKKNDVLIFDEFLTPQHEFLAYSNFCESYPHVKLEAFAASNNYTFVAFKVI